MAPAAIESYAMKTLIALFKNRQERLPKREKPRREKPLPYDWHHVIWQGNHTVMNHHPVWGFHVSQIMEERMHKVLLKKIVELECLPSLDEIKTGLRTDDMRRIISENFREKAKREMHEVDFEIGIQAACNLMVEPLEHDVALLLPRIKKGIEPAGQIIQNFYTLDSRNLRKY